MEKDRRESCRAFAAANANLLAPKALRQCEPGASPQERKLRCKHYVIMPDHTHLFVRGSLDFSLRQWVRMVNRALSRAIFADPPHWQHGFFDHLIRHSESYAEKWEYVRQNPVRAGLVQDPDEWPWQGEIVRLGA